MTTDTRTEEEAFSQGFNEARGIEPAPAEPAPAEPAEPVEPEPEDPWKDVPSVVRERFDDLTSKLSIVDKLPDRLRNIEGHIGGLTTQLKTAKAAAEAVAKGGGEAPSQAQLKDALSSSAKFAQVKEDYPEWAAAMEEILAPVLSRDPSALKGEVSKEMQEALAKARAEARAEIAGEIDRTLSEIVEARHEGWEDTVKSEGFAKWFETQPAEIKALATTPGAKPAIKLLDAYAASKKAKPATPDKDARLRAAVTPKGTPAPARQPINDDDAFEKGFQSVRG